MLSIYSNQCKSHLPPCRNYFCLNQSILSGFSFSRVFGLYYCVFSPNPCNIITVNPLTISHPVACKHIHTYTALPFSCCPSLSFSVTHINSVPPPPPNKSLAFPVSLTPNHSLPLIWNDCETTKTLWKYQIPHTIHGVGGVEDCKNPTGRKLWMRLRGWQSQFSPDATKPLQCAQIVG